MSYGLNSLERNIWGIIWGTTIGLIKGDTRSLDYSSYGCFSTWRDPNMEAPSTRILLMETPEIKAPLILTLGALTL